MNIFLRISKILLLLVSLLGILIVLPAIEFGVLERSQIIFVSLIYFSFFVGTVWRILQYGNLAKRSEDEQVKQTSGRLALIVQVIGILGVHWLAVYDFSRHSQNSTTNTFLVTVPIVLLLSSIIVNQLAIFQLGRFFDRLTIKSNHQLVKPGIYSAVRHPIYSSYLLLFIGFCLMLQSLVSLALLTVVSAIWFGSRIKIEEEMLEQEFGEEYKAYQQQTKRLIPFIY